MDSKVLHDNYLNLSKVGAKYTMYVEWCPKGDAITDSINDILDSFGFEQEEYLTITGTVLYTDGIVSILRVEHAYMELGVYTISFEDVKTRYPFFDDPVRIRQTEYLCMDVKNEVSLYYVDWDTGAIYDAIFDEDHYFMGYDMPEEAKEKSANEETLEELLSKVNDFKENLMSSSQVPKTEIRKRLLEFSQKLNNSEAQEKVVQISLSQEDEQKLEENGSINEQARSSILRVREWLLNKDCATLTTWKGRDVRTRAEDDEANKELVNILRQKGYGVTKLRGCYLGTDKVLRKENSFLVVDLKNDPSLFFDTMYLLSEKYEQECFLYKESKADIAYLIGTNDDFGKGKIVIAGRMHINSSTAENYSEISNARISFE